MADDQLEQTKEAETKDKSKKKKRLVITSVIAGSIFLLFVIIAVVWIPTFSSGGGEEQYASYSQFEEEFRQTSQDDIPYLLEPEYVRPQTFTINLKGGEKYLKIDLAYALQDEGAIIYLQEKLPILDDLVIAHIQSKTVADLNSGHGIEMLKLRLLQMANSIFDNEGYLSLAESKDRFPVKQVLITRFFLN